MNGGADAEILESFAKTTTNGASRTHRERKRSKLSDRKLCELSSFCFPNQAGWMRKKREKKKSLLKLVVVFGINSFLLSFSFFHSCLSTDPNMKSRDLEREKESCDEVHRQIDMDFTRQI